jgi:branched-chain amino acid transport system permease protein
MDLVLQQVINGVTIGAIYSLVALGYTMVYGIIRLINFAHGAVFMWGAYTGMFLLTVLGGSAAAIGLVPTLLVIFLGPMILCAFLGFAMDRGVYIHLRRRRAGTLVPLIAALGISLVLEISAMLTWGKEFRVYPHFLHLTYLTWGRAVLSNLQVILIVTCLVMMTGLHLFVTYTRTGKAMRAASQDHDAARLSGVDVDRIITLTFVIGSTLAAVAGVLVGMYYGSVNFRMGYVPGLKAFSAAVLGGVGNIPGAMIGGFIIGLIEAFGAGYIGGEWKDLIAFSILILVIIFKPTGLLGERVAERA